MVEGSEKILIVEDESIVALDIESRLKMLGYDVVGRAASGERALELASQTRPSCILMDINLQGDIDGIETATRIHEDQSVPIIYLTAFADDQTLNRARISEPYGYILKPFQERELTVTIEMALYKHRVEETLRQNHGFLSATLAAISDAVIVTGDDGEILYTNPAAEKLIQMIKADSEKKSSVPSKMMGDLCPFLKGIGNTAEKRMRFSLTVQNQLTDWEVSFTPSNFDEQATKGVYLFRDISRQLEYERTLRETRDRAEEINQAKNQLLSNMSHELRTPLNSIIGMTELTLQEELSPLAREYLDIVRTSADSLLVVINSILDFSKIDKGQLTPQMESMSLRETLKGLVEGFSTQVAKKSLVLDWDVQSILPDQFVCDREKLVLLLHQLLDNAVKFSEAGHIRLKASLNPYYSGLKTNEIALVLEVSDQGIGIAEEQVHQVFSPFSQADGSATRGYGGMGLGLALVRELVTLLRGQVELDSLPGRGTHVTVTIPAEPLEGVPEASGEAFSPGESQSGEGDFLSLEGREIFLVEDDSINRFLLKTLLAKRNVITHEFDSATAFVEAQRIHPQQADAMILDLQMPEMDGYTLLDVLRKGELAPVYSELPVLISSAHTSHQDHQACLARGADAFLPKPIESRELFLVLESFFKEQRDSGFSRPADEIETVRTLVRQGRLEEAEKEVSRLRGGAQEPRLSGIFLHLLMALRKGDAQVIDEVIDQVISYVKGGYDENSDS